MTWREIPDRQTAKPSQFKRLRWSPSKCVARNKIQISCGNKKHDKWQGRT